MKWNAGPIEGCVITSIRKFSDDRGWLGEFFRHDELPTLLHPVMGYLSLTHPGIARGPHEHVDQTDLFLFFSGAFKLYLWDAREQSTTYGNRIIETYGEDNPATVVIPPGVVHAYKNVSSHDALVVNCPNALYAGEGKKEPVDEIRHEDQEDSPFQLV